MFEDKWIFIFSINDFIVSKAPVSKPFFFFSKYVIIFAFLKDILGYLKKSMFFKITIKELFIKDDCSNGELTLFFL